MARGEGMYKICVEGSSLYSVHSLCCLLSSCIGSYMSGMYYDVNLMWFLFIKNVSFGEVSTEKFGMYGIFTFKFKLLMACINTFSEM
jgi:hypothetical protein